ncbi:MAG: pyrroline-5-carboxylate reductase [Burkholderiales bacterium]|nr:pyrroline-5-carboxylate reductase [Burkholderiales bacterium]
MRVLFIGGGNMAQAILGGLLAQKLDPANFRVVDPVLETRNAICALGVGAFAAFSTDMLDCDAIVLAVKPQIMKEAISPLTDKLVSQVVISIAAGIDTPSLARWLGNAPYKNVVRAMPNTPALIRAGISGLYRAVGVGDEDRRIADTLLASVGKTVWFDDEGMLDAVTAVSGSGPAYVFYFIEALEQAALELGFEQNAARQFATQTFLGGAQLAASSAEAPGTLRSRVTSKRGTTERAIEIFDKHALKQGFIEGVKAACVRSRELGKELGASASDPLGVSRSAG